MAQNLQSSIATMVQDLGKAYLGSGVTFCLGGRAVAPEGASLYFSSGDAARSVHLPAADSDAIAGLLAACDPGGSGAALELLSGRFSVSGFSLEGHQDVLRAVHQVMLPGAARVSAELSSLEVHRPGVPAHADTDADAPRSPGRLGTLVVCLPVPHAGGGLVVSHGDQRVVFDWGPGAARGEVQWAAFSTDCTHEVLPVTEGTRLTLVHSLLEHEGDEAVPVGPFAPALRQMLLKALLSEEFLPEGGKLGFPFCQTYDHTSPNFGEEVESLLRGEDAALFATARALGIRVAAQRIWRVRRKYPGARSSWGSGPRGETVLMVGHFGAPKFFKEYSYKDEKYVNMYPFEFIEALGGKVDPEITWVRGKKISADFTDWKLGAWNGIGSGGGCDSDAETDGMEGTMRSTIGLWDLGKKHTSGFFCAGAIILTVPTFADRKALLPEPAILPAVQAVDQSAKKDEGRKKQTGKKKYEGEPAGTRKSYRLLMKRARS